VKAVYDLLGYLRSIERGSLLMPAFLLLRVALWAMCVVLGSLGVFFAITSFSVPGVGSHAVILLSAGLGINYYLTHEKAL
jgi:hypothetical protein